MIETVHSPRIPADGAAGRVGRRSLDAVARYLWTGEPGVCEAHWGALTLVITAALSAITASWAGAVNAERTFLHIVYPAVLVALVLELPTRLAATRPWFRSMAVRRLLGPLVLVSAAFTTGLPDVVTMAPSPTAPLIIGALVYAALSRGFVPAMLVAATATITLPLLHLSVAQGTIDAAGIQVVLRGLAAVAGATCAGLAWRHLHRGQERARRRVAELERITGMVRRFDGSRPIAEVLGDVAADLVGATNAGAVIIHAGDDALAPVAMAGDPATLAAEASAPPIDRAATTRMTQPPAAGAPSPWPVARGGAARSSPIAVPVVHEDTPLAVIEVRGVPTATGADARALTELVASAIAGALRAAQLDAQRGVRLATVERLVRSGRSLSANLDRGRVVSEACALAAGLLDADLSAFVRPEDNGSWVLEDGVGFDDDAVGFTVARSPRVEENAPADGTGIDPRPGLVWTRILERFAGAGGMPHALAVPLVMDDEIVGIVGVARRRAGRAFSEADVAAADLLAIQVETALRNAVQHGHAVDLAIRDGLTGLLNRRYFDEALRRASAAAMRAEAPLSLLVMDLDRFSLVNNEHGHAVGDEVLRRVAGVLRRHTREADVVARYGGEEFVLIAPDADAEVARRVAERIRLAIADLSREPIDGLLLRTTISIGVATLGDDEVIDGTDLFRRADDRLRAAKLAGRNRVIGA